MHIPAQPQLHGDTRWLAGSTAASATQATIGGITSEAEELELENLNDWVEKQGLPRGQVSFDHADPETGASMAIFDLAWPDGLQRGLTEPIAVLLNEPAEVLAVASAAGFRCFTTAGDFRAHVESDILRLEAT